MNHSLVKEPTDRREGCSGLVLGARFFTRTGAGQGQAPAAAEYGHTQSQSDGIGEPVEEAGGAPEGEQALAGFGGEGEEQSQPGHPGGPSAHRAPRSVHPQQGEAGEQADVRELVEGEGTGGIRQVGTRPPERGDDTERPEQGEPASGAVGDSACGSADKI